MVKHHQLKCSGIVQQEHAAEYLPHKFKKVSTYTPFTSEKMNNIILEAKRRSQQQYHGNKPSVPIVNLLGHKSLLRVNDF